MKRSAATAGVFGFLVFSACVLVAASLRAQSQRKPATIKIDVDLVDILATVIDSHGQPIADLAQDSFHLSEDGVPQKIVRFEAETNRPLDLALMIDSSLSAAAEMKFEAEAAAHFIRQVVRPGDALSVFEFSDSVDQLANYSADVPQLQAAVRHIQPGAGTSMYDAVVLASQSLERRPTGRRRAIVLVTDAGETTSVSKFEDARRAAIASQALLYTIVIRAVKNENGRNTGGEHALITITDSTGGAFFTLDDYTQLQAMFDRIDRELRMQYLLGYYPNPAPPPGSLRHVEVSATAGDAVRYRKEYFTAGAPR